METALKPKYSTHELKKDIIENAEAILENRDRIKKVEEKVGCIDAHMTRHKDVIDPMISQHDVILFGEKGDNGLVSKITRLGDSMDRIEGGINKVLWVVIIAVVGAVLKLVIIP